ncbi:hypothetical protein EVAR_39853_1 [Eumeta japonica]|uniref:Uncharacterized protein n=1 Tax=Eumeta variegata TaxID=151549 RepID=A0A4C1WU36_EUMVA|nr:hypothetical protein EVAR_39853_1 [Eumeta japonica]
MDGKYLTQKAIPFSRVSYDRHLRARMYQSCEVSGNKDYCFHYICMYRNGPPNGPVTVYETEAYPFGNSQKVKFPTGPLRQADSQFQSWRVPSVNFFVRARSTDAARAPRSDPVTFDTGRERGAANQLYEANRTDCS